MKLRMIREAGSRRDLFRRMFGIGKPPEEPTGEPHEKSTGKPAPAGTPTDQEGNDPAAGLFGPEPNRRDFLRQTGGIVGTIANKHPAVKMLSSINQGLSIGRGLYDAMSDEELLSIPEDKWVGNIDPERMRKIAREHPEHGNHEATNKLYNILIYGILAKSGVKPSLAHHTAEQITKIRRENAIKVATASKGLGAIGKVWGLKQSDIMDTAHRYGIFDGGSEVESAKMAREFNDYIRKHADAYGIKRDLGMKRHKTENPETYRQQTAKVKKPTNDYDEDAAISRWESEGGATFEAKLNKVLKLV